MGARLKYSARPVAARATFTTDGSLRASSEGIGVGHVPTSPPPSRPRVIRGHARMIQHGHGLNPAPDPFDEGSAVQRVEGFSGEAGGSEPGGEDSQDPAAQKGPPGPQAGQTP